MASNSEIDELDELQIALAKFAADMKHDPEPNSSEQTHEVDMDEFNEYEEGTNFYFGLLEHPPPYLKYSH